MKKVVVISLGGSLILSEKKIDAKFLKKFREILRKNFSKYKFIVVCGGGRFAREYISILKNSGANDEMQSFAGIATTRMNARFMAYFFKEDQKEGIPSTIETLEKYIKKREVVFCGALKYKPNQTSDSTSAQIAKHFNTDLINLTNVDGLYDKNPLKNKNAKFIPKISWQEFNKRAQKIRYRPGMHFVLDPTAAKIILKDKIPTYILGKNLKQLNNFLKGKKFKGTIIFG